MIQATDLRVGNIVNDPCMGNMAVYELNKEVEYYSDAILLTPEILLSKCGFQTKNNGEWLAHPKLPDIRYKEGQIHNYITPMPHIQSIHQLQNLFYALTGEELEVNL